MEKAYTIELTPRARKAYESLDRPVRARVSAALDKMAQEPRHPGVKALTGADGVLRIRVGDWRVLYRVDDGRLVVFVIDVAHRSTVYPRL